MPEQGLDATEELEIPLIVSVWLQWRKPWRCRRGRVPHAASVRGDYGSACRFVRHLPPRIAHPCVRVDRDPIEEAQVDFGYAGLLRDPANDTLREAWGR